MTEELKRKIFYSDIIIKLITTNKVLAIYLGGSRLLGLDSPESDYDIVVITKDNSLNNFQKHYIPVENYTIHIMIHPIQGAINLIKQPKRLEGFHNSLVLIDSILCPEELFIYKTPEFKHFQQVVHNNKEALTILCLEARLNAIANTIGFPLTKYNKKYYHYLLLNFLLENFLATKELYFSQKQKDILKTFKSTQVIPAIFYEKLANRTPHKYFTSRYTYDSIYNEVKRYEQ